MTGGYRPVPTSDTSYPPSSPTLPQPATARLQNAWSKLPTKASRRLIIGGIAAFLVLVVAAVNLVPRTSIVQLPDAGTMYVDHSDPASVMAAKLAVDHTGRPGQFFRDPTPIRTALDFWDLAEKEVRAKGVDTCDDKLGRSLINAYVRHKVEYLVPSNGGKLQHIPENTEAHLPWTPSNPDGDDDGDAAIVCAPVHRDDFSKWWGSGTPASPCLSMHLRPKHNTHREYYAPRANKTDDGRALDGEMREEHFLGKAIQEGDGPKCKHKVEHTVLLIGRQDQWNP